MATILLASLSGCAHGGPIPKWDGKIYAGDSARQSMRRSQAKEECRASEPCFDDLVGITYEDFEKFYSTYVLGCEKWKDGLPMMSEKEANDRIRLFWLDMRRAARLKARRGQ